MSWKVSTRKGWQNKQSLEVGPLTLWVIAKDGGGFDIVVKTLKGPLLEEEYQGSEIQAKDRILNQTRDLLKRYQEEIARAVTLDY